MGGGVGVNDDDDEMEDGKIQWQSHAAPADAEMISRL